MLDRAAGDQELTEQVLENRLAGESRSRLCDESPEGLRPRSCPQTLVWVAVNLECVGEIKCQLQHRFRGFELLAERTAIGFQPIRIEAGVKRHGCIERHE